jgi:seryl-tRNA synthetase
VSPETTSLAGPGLKDALLAKGLLRAGTVPGLYQRSGDFESVVRGIEHAAHAEGQRVGGIEPIVYLAPIMPRDVLVKTDYLRSFPDLIGSIETFQGGDAQHAELLRIADAGEDWTQALSPSEVTLCSAACHSLYPGLSGTLPSAGRTLELQGHCFRHEPSDDPARMQSFRMHEFMHVGTPDSAVAHRDAWLSRGLELLGDLGLPVEKVVANDPFFGRAGRMLAANQRETTLKYEIVCPVTSQEKPTAIASANYHQDHFGVPFSIMSADGETAHSACFGFGLERIALALLSVHGLELSDWPQVVRDRLSL